MRVTQNQMTRLYLRNSNTALTNREQFEQSYSHQRKFTRASQILFHFKGNDY